MNNEIWKPIKGYEGKYEVSNLGRVKSKERISNCCYNSTRKTKEKIIAHYLEKNGYLSVCLFKEGKHTKRVHKLVASAFIPNPNNYPCINHINGNKLDNNMNNLEWCTYSHNVKEAFRLGLANNSEKQRNAVREYCKKHKNKPLVQLDINNNLIKEWNSAVEVEEKMGISRKNISQCVRGKNKTAGGFKWLFKEQIEQMEYNVKK